METVSVIMYSLNWNQSSRNYSNANFKSACSGVSVKALSHIALALMISGAIASASTGSAQAKTFQLGAQHASELIPAEVLSAPQPIITSDMLEQGIKTSCTAKFAIASNGKHRVELISSTGSGEVDEMTLETLRTWRFRPAVLSGEPVSSVRKIRIEFEVE